jgi:hypothetical protein
MQAGFQPGDNVRAHLLGHIPFFVYGRTPQRGRAQAKIVFSPMSDISFEAH